MLKAEHYCITAENAALHELIGLECVVAESADKSRKGMKGKVVDETKNTLVIESGGAEKTVPKGEAEFEFALGSEKALIKGSAIMFAPEQRTKALWGKKND